MVNQKNDEEGAEKGKAELEDASLKPSGTSWFEPGPLIGLHTTQCQTDFRHSVLWVRVGTTTGFSLLD